MKRRSAVKILTWCPCVLLLVAAPAAPAAPPDEAATADLARLLHKVIVAKLPPAFEDASGWGHTVPVPERMRFPRLKRTIVRVGDHDELPDGPWRKVRLRLEDPNRDVQVRVPSFKRVEGMTYRVVVEVDAAARAEADVQRWRNGVELADLTGRADVLLNIRVECDVTGRLAGKGLVLEPVVNDVKLNLKEFTPRQVTFHRTGVVLAGDRVKAAGEDLKGPIQEMLRSIEPDVKRRAGEALARAMKEGKQPLPPAEVLKAIAPLLGQK
jgi:hypothetical protein